MSNTTTSTAVASESTAKRSLEQLCDCCSCTDKLVLERKKKLRLTLTDDQQTVVGDSPVVTAAQALLVAVNKQIRTDTSAYPAVGDVLTFVGDGEAGFQASGSAGATANNIRFAGPTVVATSTAAGPATAGHVYRATGAGTAAFGAIAAGDLPATITSNTSGTASTANTALRANALAFQNRDIALDTKTVTNSDGWVYATSNSGTEANFTNSIAANTSGNAATASVATTAQGIQFSDGSGGNTTINTSGVNRPTGAGQVWTSTSNTAAAWQTPSAGAVEKLASGSGTSNSAVATNLATVAISGLGINDKLHVIVNVDGQGSTNSGNILLYNDTDGVNMASFGNAMTAGPNVQGFAYVGTNGTSATRISSISQLIANTSSTFVTAWTGSWTLALRTSGVSGGTGIINWSWIVERHIA